jgi:hypothetical protein
VNWSSPGAKKVTLQVLRNGCISSETTQIITVNGLNLIDNPCQASPLSINSSNSYSFFSNEGATLTPNVISPSCSTIPVGNDIWFKFQLNAESDIEILTQEGSLSDGAMQLLFANNCTGPYTEVLCNDEDIEDESSMPVIKVNSLSAGTYYLRFWG